MVELISRFNYPSSLRSEELHADCIALAMQRLAVSYPSLRTKFAGTRSKNQLSALHPAACASHARAFRAHIFSKGRLHPEEATQSIENHRNFHGYPVFPTVKFAHWSGRHWSLPHRHAAMRAIELRALPRCFMRYRARSAAPKSFSAVSPSSGKAAMPALTERPGSSTSLASRSRMREETREAISCGASGSTRANSSPP